MSSKYDAMCQGVDPADPEQVQALLETVTGREWTLLISGGFESGAWFATIDGGGLWELRRPGFRERAGSLRGLLFILGVAGILIHPPIGIGESEYLTAVERARVAESEVARLQDALAKLLNECASDYGAPTAAERNARAALASKEAPHV